MAALTDQLEIIKRGCDELLVEAELVDKLQVRPPAARQGGVRSDRAGPAHRPHRADQQTAAVTGPGPPRRVSDRRFHGHDRRPDRQERHAPAAHARGSGGQREDLHRAGIQDTRCGEDRDRVQFGVDGQVHFGRHDQARGKPYRRAHARTRRFRQALQGKPADCDPRIPLPAGAGLRLGRAEGRSRARRHRPEIQSADGTRAAETLRPAAAVHTHHAAARRSRRHRQDVEVARQLRRHHRHPRTKCSAS